MKQYSLLREDLDNLMELCQWPDRDSPLSNVEPKVKAAFTRQYNKEVVLPFATGALALAGRKRAAATSAEDAWAAEEAGEEEEEEEKDDIETDGMIKAKKAKAPAKQAAGTSGRGRGGAKGGASKRGRK